MSDLVIICLNHNPLNHNSLNHKIKMTFDNLVALKAAVGQEIGTSDWLTVTQEMINDFAKATLDFQWIHLNQEMAAQYSPFKTTIAHGFLTLSLAPKFMGDLLQVKSVKMGVNYGTNKVRFTSAVPSGGRVRMKGTITEVEDVPRGVKLTMNCIFELEGSEKPACIAELISMMYE
jgi:acyl dehydratase